VNHTSLSRRRFLGGAAVAIALPPFESLLGKTARAQATPRRRLVTVFLPIGMIMDEWTPAATGPLQLSPMTAAFEKVKQKVLILTHLANLSGKNRPGDHAAGTGAVFNCTRAAKGDGAAIRAGVSVDQVAAQHLRQFTPVPSLQLGVIKGRRTGVCEAGYSCVLENTISWADERTPLPPAQNPAAVFDQLFAGLDPRETAAARTARIAGKRSLLDYVRDESRLLAGKLGRSDATKLDQLLTGIGDIERQLQTSSATSCGSMTRPAPDSDTPDYKVNAQVMNALIATAFQCDVTRVVSHQIAPSYPAISYSHIGVSAGHHSLSHFHSAGDKVLYRKCAQWHMTVIADLLEKLDAIDDGGGTLLDHTFVVQSSDIGNPQNHDHAHLPVLVGGGGGVFKMGRHVSYPVETPIANLFISVLNGLGVPATSFGADGKGPLSELT
jgi:hypothetical protein